MPQYRILPGGSFRMPDNTVKTAPEVIELDTDVAARHAGVLAEVATEAAPETQAADLAANQE